MSLFRYGLDYVQMAIQRLIGFVKKEEFKEILAILRRQNPDRIMVLWNLSCTEINFTDPDNLIEGITYLFENKSKIMVNNYHYYNNFVRPDSLIMNSLFLALNSDSWKY